MTNIGLETEKTIKLLQTLQDQLSSVNTKLEILLQRYLEVSQPPAINEISETTLEESQFQTTSTKTSDNNMYYQGQPLTEMTANQKMNKITLKKKILTLF